MPSYRAYVVGPDGQFQNFIYLNCQNEDEARGSRGRLQGILVKMMPFGLMVRKF